MQKNSKQLYLQHICFWCGNYAKYQFKSGKWCCQKTYRACNGYKEKVSLSLKLAHQNKLKYRCEYHAWNKGLTKQTNQIVKKAAETLHKRYQNGQIQSWFKGKHWTQQQKKMISQTRKKYLKQHPDQVPYLLNHSSKMSYPEQYFNQVIKDRNINAKYHLQVGLYQLDFYNDQLKKDLQIDGEQHFINQKNIDRDMKRNQYLISLGWQIKRVRWSQYQKLNKEEKLKIIQEIQQFFKN